MAAEVAPHATATPQLDERLVARLSALEDVGQAWKRTNHAAFVSRTLPQHRRQLEVETESVLASRKIVSQRTRDFAKLAPEERDKEIGSLVKGYQQHIDAVTNALKLTNGAFEDVSSHVTSLVDPTIVVEQILRDRPQWKELAGRQGEINALRRRISERETELSELKNQEVTVQQLRDALADAEMAVVASRQAVDDEASLEVTRMAQQWREREAALLQDLSTATQECRRVNYLNADLTTELLAVKQKLEDMANFRDEDAVQATADHQQLHLFYQQEQRRLQATIAAQQQQLDAHYRAAPPDRVAAAAANADDATSSTPSSGMQSRKEEANRRCASDEARDESRWASEDDHSGGLRQLLADSEGRCRALSRQTEAAVQRLRAADDELEALRRAAADMSHRCLRAEHDHQSLRCRLELAQSELNAKTGELASWRQRVAALEASEQALRRNLLEMQREISHVDRTRTRAVADGDIGPTATPTTRSAAMEANALRDRNEAASLEQVLNGGAAGSDVHASAGPRTTFANRQPPPEEANSSSTTIADSLASAQHTMAALAEQRDRYRQRAAALEEVSCREIEGLQQTVKSLRHDNQQLLAALSGTTTSAVSSSGNATMAAVMEAGGGAADGVGMDDDKPLFRGAAGSSASAGSCCGGAADKVIAAVAQIIYVRIPRRSFVLYMMALHVWMIIVVLRFFWT